MIGRFLELSIVTPDIRRSLDFYRALGFSEAQVGDAWTHPYAVVTDGRICLGLHEQTGFGASITFVKPDLLQHLGGLERLAAEFAICRLGSDVFNELGWLDPSGHLVRLVEARTFSPSKRSGTDSSLSGYFQEIGLPAPSREAATFHWESCGFVGIDEPDSSPPRVACTSDTIDIGLYDPGDLRAPALIFGVDDLRNARSRLAAVGIAAEKLTRGSWRHATTAQLTAPEGTALLLVQADLRSS